MGPITAAELESLGIDSVERLQVLGCEQAFLRWVEAYPARLNVNAAVGLVAAELGVSWLNLGARDRARAVKMVNEVRREWGLSMVARRRRRGSPAR
jgi:hypothetical protein